MTEIIIKTRQIPPVSIRFTAGDPILKYIENQPLYYNRRLGHVQIANTNIVLSRKMAGVIGNKTLSTIYLDGDPTNLCDGNIGTTKAHVRTADEEEPPIIADPANARRVWLLIVRDNPALDLAAWCEAHR